MIVSTSIDVLPVCLSPITSSLCPLPIGIIESIDLIPVCKGSNTDFLSIIPGAGASTGLVLSAAISPLPSIACPRALTTRPIIASPTGTSTILPVLFTMSPSFISVSSPSITAPTTSSSKFNAIPNMFPGNSSSSPDMAFSKP